jgi:hypothetical protein
MLVPNSQFRSKIFFKYHSVATLIDGFRCTPSLCLRGPMGAGFFDLYREIVSGPQTVNWSRIAKDNVDRCVWSAC